jgi:hypothetical protein
MPSSTDLVVRNSSNRLVEIDRLKQVVQDIDADRALEVKTEDGITQGNLRFGSFFKVKFAYTA